MLIFPIFYVFCGVKFLTHFHPEAVIISSFETGMGNDKKAQKPLH